MIPDDRGTRRLDGTAAAKPRRVSPRTRATPVSANQVRHTLGRTLAAINQPGISLPGGYNAEEWALFMVVR